MENERRIPVARMEFFSTSGEAEDWVNFYTEEEFLEQVKKENEYGVPAAIILFRNEAGKTISADFVDELDPPNMTVRVADYDETLYGEEQEEEEEETVTIPISEYVAYNRDIAKQQEELADTKVRYNEIATEYGILENLKKDWIAEKAERDKKELAVMLLSYAIGAVIGLVLCLFAG